MTKSIDQNLYTLIYKASIGLGNKTYPFNPKQDVEYPFVVIRDILQSNRITKSYRGGDLKVDIHVYGDNEKVGRGGVSIIINNLINAMRNIKGDQDVFFCLEPNTIQNSVIPDTSTERDLWHGLIECEFKYYLK